MKSLKTKLLLTVIGMIVVSCTVLIAIAYPVAKKELTVAVSAEMDAIVGKVGEQISSLNYQAFQLLSSLAAMPVIKDDSTSLYETNNQMTAISATDQTYV